MVNRGCEISVPCHGIGDGEVTGFCESDAVGLAHAAHEVDTASCDTQALAGTVRGTKEMFWAGVLKGLRGHRHGYSKTYIMYRVASPRSGEQDAKKNTGDEWIKKVWSLHTMG